MEHRSLCLRFLLDTQVLKIWADVTCCQLPCAKVNQGQGQVTSDLKPVKKVLKTILHSSHLTWAQFGLRFALYLQDCPNLSLLRISLYLQLASVPHQMLKENAKKYVGWKGEQYYHKTYISNVQFTVLSNIPYSVQMLNLFSIEFHLTFGISK